MRAAFLFALVIAAPVAAQVAPRAAADGPEAYAVVAVAKRLFDGMRAHDSTMIASAFAPGAKMTGVPPAGRPVDFQSVTGFVVQAGRSGLPWDEQIYDPEIRVDGDLATLHVFYTFSLGEKFSHCGIDVMWLIRTPEGWQISALADTRRSSGCETTGRSRVR
ncbi:MAG: nuclear transport factor 2 family protein [Gemmatimonadota bacterium]